MTYLAFIAEHVEADDEAVHVGVVYRETDGEVAVVQHAEFDDCLAMLNAKLSGTGVRLEGSGPGRLDVVS